MKKIITICVVALVFMLVHEKSTFATLINFDDVASGSVINNQYTGLGATFDACNQCAVGTGGSIYAVTPGGFVSPLDSSPNGVSVRGTDGTLSQGVLLGGDVIQATFSTLQQNVSIDVYTLLPPEYLGPMLVPLIYGLNSSGTAVSGDTGIANQLPVADVSTGAWYTISVNDSSADIASVLIGLPSGSYVGSWFDNLCFVTDNSTTGCGGSGGNNNNQVPEPSSILLLGLGVVGLAIFGRNRFKTV